MSKALGCLIILLLIPSLSWGVNYYIDTDCADGGDGTTTECDGGADDAWNELSDISGLAAGDTIHLNKGDTWNEELIVPTSGTSGNQIIFTAYGTGNLPIIDAENTRDSCVKSDTKDYITISKLDVRRGKLQNIWVIKPTGVIVEKNLISGTDVESTHGIKLEGTSAGFDCIAEIRYNYIDNTGDDGVWTPNCTLKDGVEVYGNVCHGTGDDCFDIDSTDGISAHVSWYNNICISGSNVFGFDTCFEISDTGGGFSTVIMKNNTTLLTATADCENELGCHVFFVEETARTNSTLENNNYYSATGVEGKGFYVLSTTTEYNLAEWQAVGMDTNSINADPLIDTSLYGVTKQGSSAIGAGQDLCSIINGYLEVGSTWIDDNVTVFRQCPSNTGNEWNIGAYGTRGECPVSIKY